MKRAADDVRSAAELERVLGYAFRRPELLTLALTHRSFVYDGETGGTVELQALADPGKDNEQLEFVGDAVLGLVAAESLCRRFPALREGELTRMRASVVSRRHLGAVGTALGLGEWLRLGYTAERNDGRRNTALFANAVEAVIAAIYLDGGLEAARGFVEERVLGPALPELERSVAGADGSSGVSGAVGDYKSALQELLQADGSGRPAYKVIEESGPAHKRVFRVQVAVETGEGLGAALAEADGTSKKEAQQEAARLALARLGYGGVRRDG